jgi:hypothetical protein
MRFNAGLKGLKKDHAAVKSIRTHSRTFPARNYTHITDQFTVHRSHPIRSAIATDFNYSQSGICSLLLTVHHVVWQTVSGVSANTSLDLPLLGF